MDPNQANLFLAALKNHLQGTPMAGMADYLTGLHKRAQTPSPPLPPVADPATTPPMPRPKPTDSNEYVDATMRDMGREADERIRIGDPRYNYVPQGLARYANPGAPPPIQQQAPPAAPAFGTPRERAGSGAAPPGNRLAMYAQ